MKKLLYITAGVLLPMFCGCSSETDIHPVVNDEIAFNTYIAQPTKVAVADLAQVQTDGFYVYAAQHSGNYGTQNPEYIVDQHVTYQTDTWDYTPHRYWPNNGDKLTFFAYSIPETKKANVSVDKTTGMKLTYTVPKLHEDHADLLGAKVANKSRIEGGTEDVHFQFDHLLSKIGFMVTTSADLTDEGFKISIKNLTITYGAALRNKGTYDFNTGDWTLDETSQFLLNNQTEILNGDFLLTEADGGYKPHAATGDNFAMFLPQIYAPEDITVDCTFRIQTLAPDGSIVSDDDVSMASQLPAVPDGNGWQKGKQYVYPVNFAIKEIKIGTPTVQEWVDKTVD